MQHQQPQQQSVPQPLQSIQPQPLRPNTLPPVIPQTRKIDYSRPQQQFPYTAASFQIPPHLSHSQPFSYPATATSSSQQQAFQHIQQQPQQPQRTKPAFKYSLSVKQQPIRARMCGFGEKDRRPIDPPPVVHLNVTDDTGKSIPIDQLDISMYVIHADIWSLDGQEDRNLVINPASLPSQSGSAHTSTVLSLNSPSTARNLMGSLVSSAYILTDESNVEGLHFVFQDLSVRTEGTFTLRFSFADLANTKTPFMSCDVETTVLTEPFKVYSPKKFPGMTESTKLSKIFARQGIKIPIRKENRLRSRPTDAFFRTGGTNSASGDAANDNNSQEEDDEDEDRS